MSTTTLEPEPPPPEPSPGREERDEVVCNQIFALTRAFLTGELSNEQNRRLRAHLDRCGPCRDEYRGAVMTAASIGHAQRRARTDREREARRDDFRRLVREASAGPTKRARNWRLILYPLVAIVMLTQLSRIGQGGDALRAEVMAGALDVGRIEWTPETGARPLEPGQRCELSADGLARLANARMTLDLSGASKLLVVGLHPVRLRLEAGRAILRGRGELVTLLGVVEVDGAAVEVNVDGGRLEVRGLEGEARFLDALGLVELAEGESLQRP